MRAVVLNPGRKRKRRRRRKARNYSHWIPAYKKASNPKRRRRRKKRRNYSHWIPAYKKASNSRRRRRRRKNPFWVPRYASNNPPMSLAGKLTAPVQPAYLMKGAALVGGGLASAAVKGLVKKYSGFSPEGLVGDTALGFASAGLTAFAAGAIKKSLWFPVLMGGIVNAMTPVVAQVLGNAGLTGMGCMGGNCGCMGGDCDDAYLGDYLTPTNVANARALGSIGCSNGYCGNDLQEFHVGQELAS